VILLSRHFAHHIAMVGGFVMFPFVCAFWTFRDVGMLSVFSLMFACFGSCVVLCCAVLYCFVLR
jgi:uncharacterized membrane protein YeaQ/YmgE (transglycosylase-associated protein family)